MSESTFASLWRRSFALLPVRLWSVLPWHYSQAYSLSTLAAPVRELPEIRGNVNNKPEDRDWTGGPLGDPWTPQDDCDYRFTDDESDDITRQSIDLITLFTMFVFVVAILAFFLIMLKPEGR